MKSIWKYELRGAQTKVVAPIEKWLKVQWQDGTGIVVWAMINDNLPKRTFWIHTVGTGWDIENLEGDYIGSEIDEFGFVWHYFVREVEE